MKILDVGINADTALYLTEHSFVLEQEQITTLDQLLEWCSFSAYNAVVINFAARGWDPNHTASAVRLKNRTTALIGLGEMTAQSRAAFLNHGGDDFLSYPTYLPELTATLHATMRRYMGGCVNVQHFRVGDSIIKVDATNRVVTINDTPLPLSPMEASVMVMLSQNVNKLQTREKLLESLYAYKDEASSRTLDAFLYRIRHKLNEAQPGAAVLIKTVRGRGYTLASEAIRMN